MTEVTALLLINPKYPHNVGAAVRAAACWGVETVLFTGSRVSLKRDDKFLRLPREERMRDYQDVKLLNVEKPFDMFPGLTPIGVEFTEGATKLPVFTHLDEAMYVFGPEDGSLNRVTLLQCHDLVVIPTMHCLNLGAAVNVVLYDRETKMWT